MEQAEAEDRQKLEPMLKDFESHIRTLKMMG
jgi:hypothetical protein